MATNTSNSTHNNTSHEDWMPLPASQCIPWLVVLIPECLAIVILNVITIIVFVKQRQLQRRSTYLIVHLAIVDLLVGAVSGPLEIEWTGERCDLWETNSNRTFVFLKHVFILVFPSVSLVNLAVISLERVHATFFPFKHRFIKKWVYGVIITVSWLTGALTLVAQGTSFYFSTDFHVSILYFSIFVTLLFVICVSYISIFIKVRFSRRPQHHGAAGVRERKLTRTLFFVALGSLLTWLTPLLQTAIGSFHPQLYYNLSSRSFFHIDRTVGILFLANSLINPIIYAMRMPELRAGILQIIFRRTPNRSNPVDLPLRNR